MCEFQNRNRFSEAKLEQFLNAEIKIMLKESFMEIID